MASAPLREEAGPVAATGPAGVPAVHKAAPQAAVLLLYALLGKEGKAVRRIAPVGLRHGRAKREQADGAQHKPQKQHEKTHFTPSFPKTQNNKNKTFHPI